MEIKSKQQLPSNDHFMTKEDNFINMKVACKSNGLPIPDKRKADILQNEELYTLLCNNSLLIGVSRPIISRTFYTLSDTANLFFLTDNEGFIVDLIGSADILLSYSDIGIKAGVHIRQASCGIDANRIAIFKKSRADFLKNTKCTVAPIMIANETIGYAGAIYAQDLYYFESLIITMTELITSHLNNFRYKESQIYYINNSKDKEYTTKRHFYGSLMLNDKFDFTFREIEILYLIYIKQEYEMITSQLCISKNTLKTHIKNIYVKLSIKNSKDCLSKITLLLDDNTFYSEFNK